MNLLGYILLFFVASLLGCEKSTTITESVKLAAPPESNCVVRVAKDSYGSGAVDVASPNPLHFGINLSGDKAGKSFANVRLRREGTQTTLEIATGWWGTPAMPLINRQKLKQLRLLQSILDRCAPADVVEAAKIECLFTQGSNETRGCEEP